MINTTELLRATMNFERKAKIEAVISHILPRVVQANIESEMLLRIARGQPPSVPIFAYRDTSLNVPDSGDTFLWDDATQTPSTIQDLANKNATMVNGTPIHAQLDGDVLQVLYTILGPHFSIHSKDLPRKLISEEKHFKVYEICLVAKFNVHPRTTGLSWIQEMWPNLSQIRVQDGGVIWNPLPPRDDPSQQQEEWLEKLREADRIVDWRQSVAGGAYSDYAAACWRQAAAEAAPAVAEPKGFSKKKPVPDTTKNAIWQYYQAGGTYPMPSPDEPQAHAPSVCKYCAFLHEEGELCESREERFKRQVAAARVKWEASEPKGADVIVAAALSAQEGNTYALAATERESNHNAAEEGRAQFADRFAARCIQLGDGAPAVTAAYSPGDEAAAAQQLRAQVQAMEAATSSAAAANREAANACSRRHLARLECARVGGRDTGVGVLVRAGFSLDAARAHVNSIVLPPPRVGKNIKSQHK